MVKSRGPTFKFEVDNLLNFEGMYWGLNFKLYGVPGSTFKLWGGSRVPDPRVSKPRVPVTWFHFYTMPIEKEVRIRRRVTKIPKIKYLRKQFLVIVL